MSAVKKHATHYPRWIEHIEDAKQPLSVFVTEEDIKDAVPEDGEFCVFGRAVTRATGGRRGYFYKTKALIEMPDGTIMRYNVPPKAQRDVITPLDEGRPEQIKAGVYTLTAPRGRERLGVPHNPTGGGRKLGPEKRDKTKPHRINYALGRVINAQAK